MNKIEKVSLEIKKRREETEKMGEENSVLKKIGEENILRYVGFLLDRLQNKLVNQRVLVLNEMITLK